MVFSNIMMSLISVSKAQKHLQDQTRRQRLILQMTQQELAERSGVSLPSLRKFEQKGLISLESFLKLHLVLGGLEKIVQALQAEQPVFTSLDEVLAANNRKIRQRGRRK